MTNLRGVSIAVCSLLMGAISVVYCCPLLLVHHILRHSVIVVVCVQFHFVVGFVGDSQTYLYKIQYRWIELYKSASAIEKLYCSSIYHIWKVSTLKQMEGRRIRPYYLIYYSSSCMCLPQPSSISIHDIATSLHYLYKKNNPPINWYTRRWARRHHHHQK